MNAASKLGEAISAASLVLAVLAALYTLWLPAVSDALKIVPKTDSDDRAPQQRQTWVAIWSKAVPLAIATISATGILTPRALAILREIYGLKMAWQYDDVKALFILTWALLFLLTLVAGLQLVALIAKLVELRRH